MNNWPPRGGVAAPMGGGAGERFRAGQLTRSAPGGGQDGVMAEDVRPVSRDTTTEVGLEELVSQAYDRLLRVAALICGDRADAQDAVQVALERAWRHSSSLREPDRRAAWLHRIVVNEALRLERRRGRLGRWLARPREILVEAAPSEVRDAGLRDALRALSADQRAAIVLHHYAGYSVAETADLLGVPLETARSRLRVARVRLRDLLGAAE